jgi:hypothetical protein
MTFPKYSENLERDLLVLRTDETTSNDLTSEKEMVEPNGFITPDKKGGDN